jgi:alpha-glucosidase
LNFARRMIAWRRQQPQLTRGDIVFFDAPEPVLALRRDLEGHPGILAMFNLGPAAVSFTLAQAAGAVAMSGHGLPGSVDGTSVTLPPYGAWFGTIAQ